MNSLKRLSTRSGSPPSSGAVSPTSTMAPSEFGATPVTLKSSEILVKIHLLDEKQAALEIPTGRDVDGRWLFDEVCVRLGGLQESDYFGLTYIDKQGQWQWLQFGKNCYRQLKGISPYEINFRVKHYPPTPVTDLQQDLSRYFLYLQVRLDLLKGRLLSDPEEQFKMAACVAQAELGDYDDLDDKVNYLRKLKLVHKQTAKMEESIIEQHKLIQGMSIRDAEKELIGTACKLPTYGVYPFEVLDQKGGLLYLGLTHDGVVTFEGSKRIHLFRWTDILKLNFEGKHFVIHVTLRQETNYQKKASESGDQNTKHTLYFKCDTKQIAKAIWKWAVDRQCFFTLNQASEAKSIKSKGGLFKRSQTFRFSGRCQKELITTSQSLKDEPQPSFVRVSSIRREERLNSSDNKESAASKYATFPRQHKKKDNEDNISDVVTPGGVNGKNNGDSSDDADSSTLGTDGPEFAPKTDVVEVEVDIRTHKSTESAPHHHRLDTVRFNSDCDLIKGLSLNTGTPDAPMETSAVEETKDIITSNITTLPVSENSKDQQETGKIEIKPEGDNLHEQNLDVNNVTELEPIAEHVGDQNIKIDNGEIIELSTISKFERNDENVKDEDDKDSTPNEDSSDEDENKIVTEDVKTAVENENEQRVSKELDSTMQDFDNLLDSHQMSNGQLHEDTIQAESSGKLEAQMTNHKGDSANKRAKSSIILSLLAFLVVLFLIISIAVILGFETSTKQNLMEFEYLREFHDHIYQPARESILGGE